MNVLALLVSTAVLFPSPGARPEAVQAGLHEPFTVGALRYRLTSVQDGVKSYVSKFDQRGSKLTPGFDSERLVVFQFEVENTVDRPQEFPTILPALTYGDGSMTDRAQWDVEQKSLVRTTNDLQLNAQDYYSFSFDPISVAPGGKVHFALAFSHPSRSKAIQISFEPGKTMVTSGTIKTTHTAGPRYVISLIG